MAEPLRKSEESPENSEEAPDGAEEREPKATLGEDIRARVIRPHKGEVGNPGTNEEVFQGSKGKERF